MKVLIDMDGVVADFVGAVLAGLDERGVHIERADIDQFTYLDWASKHVDWARDIACRDGFFLGLEPLPGAIEGVKRLADVYDLQFCSSPLPGSSSCEEDKRRWIEKYFGKELAVSAYIGADKTLCDGDVLIDDNPEVKGAREPSWNHIVFDQTWNHESRSLRLLGFDDPDLIMKIESV